MKEVNAENIRAEIARLEGFIANTTRQLSIYEEYNLRVYRKLLAFLEWKPVGYTTERAATYEIWNCGSTVFDNEPYDEAVKLFAMMPDGELYSPGGFDDDD